ncbi:hypothetical protein SAMN05444920_103557 [Nonomuraea solani]|uniref:Htaa protein n=1 Tax=Nonomuraea solani TaxID=1144553 RepID=A0A1H6BQ31_9ACTN|nr:hypothetical protein [Nonomuraea solani]SEG62813.1 hypothetical protein SAMN05444920_103557 [Nonomuraea solani]
MSIKRIAIIAAAVLTSLTLTPTAALAADPPPPKPGPGMYIAPWGTAHFQFGAKLHSELQRTGTTLTGINPVNVPDGRTLVMKVGMQHNNINTGVQIYYPGGWSLNNPGQGTQFDVDPFWLNIVQGGTNAAVKINGTPADDNYKLATFNSAQVAETLRPRFFGYKIDKFPMKLTARWAADLNRLFGTRLVAGDPFGDLTVDLTFVPPSGGA